jgi:hypothetical protein
MPQRNSLAGWCSPPIFRAFSARRYSVRDEDVARLSPLIHEHINMLGRYSFVVPEPVVRGKLRPLRTPADEEP